MIIQLEKEVKPGEWLVVLNLEDCIALDTLRHLRQHSGGYRYRLQMRKESYHIVDDGCTK